MPIAQQANPLDTLLNALTAVTGKSTTQNTSSNVSAEGINAMLQQILGSSQGLAQVSSGQKSAGLYNTTTNQQLVNDLITRASGEVAKQTAGTTTTTRQNPQITGDVLAKSLGTMAAMKLLGPSAKGLAKKTGVDKWGDKLAESLGLGGNAISSSVAGVPGEVASSLASSSAITGADALGISAGLEFGADAIGMSAADFAAADALGTAGIAADAALTADIGATAAATAGTDIVGSAVADAAGADIATEIATVALWVICTELHSQGRLSDELYAASGERALKLPQDVLDGYHYWAVPLVGYLRKSVVLSKLFQFLATSRCEYLLGKKRFWGWLSVVAGEPICAAIGRKLAVKTDWKVLYG